MSLRGDPDTVAEIQRIRGHPVMLGIRKRKALLRMVKNISPGKDKKKDKQFVELLIHHDFTRLDQLLIHSYISQSELRKPKENEYVFTQRQILNKEHELFFEDQSAYKRPIVCYDDYSIQKKNKKTRRTQRDKDILVSFYTKYPYQMTHYFGSFKLYQHISGDEPVTYLSVVEYGLDQVDITGPDIQQMLVRLIADLDKDGASVLEEYNGWITSSGQAQEYSSVDDLIHAIQSDSYELQYYDYYLLSFAILRTYERGIGFALYTNRYAGPDPVGLSYSNQAKFELLIVVQDEVLKGNLKDIPMVCIYEDYHIQPGEKRSLKNIVYPGEGATLGTLGKKKMFKKIWNREYNRLLIE